MSNNTNTFLSRIKCFGTDGKREGKRDSNFRKVLYSPVTIDLGVKRDERLYGDDLVRIFPVNCDYLAGDLRNYCSAKCPEKRGSDKIPCLYSAALSRYA